MAEGRTTTTYAAVSGQSGSGGSETQNFCYDSQNRLIWAGNGGTQPSAGTGTCGSGTLANTLSGAGYTNTYSYTNLDQLWLGSLNGTGSTEQDLYCNSAPHALTGVYPTGTTCATKGSATAAYSASYDPWGNEIGRVYQNVTETLSYDALNRLVREGGSNNTQESYLYDASSKRVLTRSTSASTTSLTVYAFGLQELTYTSIGAYSSQFDYYTLAGHLVGWSNGSSITYDLTDAKGSVLLIFSASIVLGEQDYGPYGNQRYIRGTIGTDKGYTGQFADAVTGLDYYNARWYDPVSATFLSVDTKQGNAQGMDPYAYVSGNPETKTDPSGQYFTDGQKGDRAYNESDNLDDPAHSGWTLQIFVPQNPADRSSPSWVNLIHYSRVLDHKGNVVDTVIDGVYGHSMTKASHGSGPRQEPAPVAVAPWPIP